MKNYLIVVFIFVSVGTIFAQEQLAIREKIVPLQSTRSDVEKVARFVKDYLIYVKYETDNELIYVTYSNGSCKNSNWNIPANRVISYEVYPKQNFVFEDVIKEIKKLPYSVDDTLTYYYTDVSKGITYAVDYSASEIKYVEFLPSVADDKLRCKSTPTYDPVGESYTPYQEFTIKNISDWDGTVIYGTLYNLKTNSDYKGYIFLYCKKENIQACNNLKTNIENYSKRILKTDIKRLTILFGGYREEDQVETFLLLKNQPPPKPKPSFSNP